MHLGRDNEMSEGTNRNILCLTDEELSWLLADVDQVSFEYYISQSYQSFADSFKKECERLGIKL
jgi:hypothetical protein